MTHSLMQEGPYVFLSYSSTNRELVLPIIGKLQEAGARVWVDIANIPPGANYGLEIAKAIQGSSLVVLAVTGAALESRNVKQEIQLAWKHHRPYLPLLLEPVTLTPEIEYWLEGYQWIQVFDEPEEHWLPPVIRALEKAGVPVMTPRSMPAPHPSVVIRTPSTPHTVIAPISIVQSGQVEARPPVIPTQSVPPPPVAAPAVASPPAASRDATRFLLPALSGAGVLVVALMLLLVLALSRGDGTNSGTTPTDTNSAGVSQPALGAAAAPAAPAVLSGPGAAPPAAAAAASPPPAQARTDLAPPARIMPMGS